METIATQSRSPEPTDSPSPRVEERRRHHRKELKVEVGFYTESNFYTGFANDISEGGLFLATYELLPIGAELDLDFSLPDGSEIRVCAEVRWVRDPRNADANVPPGMGVQFRGLSEEERQRIEEFVELREPLFYEA